MKPFVPSGYRPPARLETNDFIIRPITIHDVVMDYDAVMSSREHLWRKFGEIWGWPPADMTLEQDLIDLAWHQKEAQLNNSYNYAVLSRDKQMLLGCVYLDPTDQPGCDVEIWYWIRTGPDQAVLESRLGHSVREWVHDEWVFKSPFYPETPV